jgi:hypothetical protein
MNKYVNKCINKYVSREWPPAGEQRGGSSSNKGRDVSHFPPRHYVQTVLRLSTGYEDLFSMQPSTHLHPIQKHRQNWQCLIQNFHCWRNFTLTLQEPDAQEHASVFPLSGRCVNNMQRHSRLHWNLYVSTSYFLIFVSSASISTLFLSSFPSLSFHLFFTSYPPIYRLSSCFPLINTTKL